MIHILNHYLWTYPIPFIMLVMGVIFTYRLRALPQRRFYQGFLYLFERPDSKKGVSPFKGLMVAMAGTVGTGNIAGVATAITLGGPGALFFIWMMGLLALAIKYAETWCAVRYHIKNKEGYVGGPSYYIQQAFKGKFGLYLGMAYMLFVCGSGLGIGSMVQSNSVASAAKVAINCPEYLTGMLLVMVVGLVVYGGIQRIAVLCAFLVPVMIVIYFSVTVGILLLNIKQLPDVLSLVIHSAFNGQGATKGFAGASIWAAMHYGLSRGIFANEAGMGSAAIAHASVDTHLPVRQSYIAIVGTCIDTFIVCTLTGLVVLLSGQWMDGQTGSVLTASAIVQFIGPVGFSIVMVCLVLFALSTILSWGYYTEVVILCFFKEWVLSIYRLIWLLGIFVGAMLDLHFVWEIADLFNGLMLVTNMMALFILTSNSMINNVNNE